MLPLYFFGALCVIGIIGIAITLIYKYMYEHKNENKIYEGFATKKDVVKFKSDIIIWMFIFWICQVATVIALFLLMHKK
jgi:uncharacterized membrane-anchored protein